MFLRTILKRIMRKLPRFFRIYTVVVREWWWQTRMFWWEQHTYPGLPEPVARSLPIKNILIYAIHGLAHAGTEKNLQLIANGLSEHYRVFFMYGDKTIAAGRAETISKKVTLIPFSYRKNEVSIPHRLQGMKPHLKNILAQYEIDLIVTATPGYAHYPWNVIRNIPIVVSNVFGAPTLQKNIVATIFMSQTVRNHAEAWTGKQLTHHTMFLPLGKEPPKNTRELGAALRQKFGIKKTEFVFGRIGRDSDAIFDPIAIRAWKKIVEYHPHAHYLIMSPPPALIKIVREEKIPRVHFLPPSGKEEDVWAFHGALDCFAHFRRDGETSGVAIAESLSIGNPIITHRSHIWNAHLEYLTPNCARVAGTDSIDDYAMHMQEYIKDYMHTNELWKERCVSAKQLGALYFSPARYLEDFRRIITQIGNP